MVSGRDMSDEANIVRMKDVGLGSERARDDSAKTIDWTDLEAGVEGGGVGPLS